VVPKKEKKLTEDFEGVLSAQKMAIYWVKEKSLILPWAQVKVMQKLIKNLTGFFIRASFILAFEIPWLVHLGLHVGVSAFIPLSFTINLNHAPFHKSLVKHSVTLGL
jgi:hypothetical protein